MLAKSDFGVGIDYKQLPGHIRQIVSGDVEEPLDLLRTYYYNALPYKSSRPTPDEAQRLKRATRFHDFLRSLPKFEAREGWLAYRGQDASGRPIFQQKQVDMLLGLDIALLNAKRQISHMVVISGDSDLAPAIDVAREEGVVVWLFHGPQNRRSGQSSVA